MVQHDLLFEIVDLVHERDTQGALLFVERLSQGGTDYGQFIKDLLGHLRDLYVVKHTAETPASIALTEEQLDGLRSQANRVSTARTVAFIDLLGEALRAVRQGSDPRLELELVLIKMTAPGRRRSRAAGAAGGAGWQPRRRRRAPAPRARAAEPAAERPARRPRADPPDGTGVLSAGSRPAPTPAAAVRRSRRDLPAEPRGRRRRPACAADIDHLQRAWPVSSRP